MKTNCYGSDFGIHKGRVDIKLNVPNGVRTIKEVIDLINKGETVIKTKLVTPDFNRAYTCKLAKKIKAVGINDIRFGTMTHYIGGGVGYTLYKD